MTSKSATANEPKVSVIIATYNYSTVLRYAIKSVLWQTFRDFELIVAGDCCTDDSEQVVRSFADPRVRWLNLPENSGSKSIPQNAGIRIARGQYIAYLAHDDLWHPCHLETVVRAIEQSGADLAYSVAVYVPPPGDTRRLISGVFPEGEFRRGHTLLHSSTIHRRDFIAELGDWPDHRTTSLPADHLFFMRAIEAGKRFFCVPKLTVWKFNASSRPGSYLERRCDEQARYFELIRDDPALAEKELIDVARSAMAHGLVPLEIFKTGRGAAPGSFIHYLRQVRGLEPAEPMLPLDLDGNAHPFHMDFAEALPGSVACDERFQLEVRLRNDSGHLLTSHAPNPVNFSYHWLHPDGPVAVFDGERTPLIPPLEPDCERHYIATFKAPDTPGFYRLQPAIVQEYVNWFDHVASGDPSVIEVRDGHS